VLNVVIGTLLIGTMLNGMTIMDVSYSRKTWSRASCCSPP